MAKAPSRVEVLNDLNGEVICLFRVVQAHPEEFLRCVRWSLKSREEFKRLRASPPETLTDIQRAARIFYLFRTGFAGFGKHFGGANAGGGPISIYRIEEALYEIHHRLESVILESLPYEECLRRYDGPGAFFYCDPPYYSHENDYGPGIFGREDFTRLAQILRQLSGQFLLSLNDVPEVRQTFAIFNFLEVKTTYSTGTQSGQGKKARELLIANYDLATPPPAFFQ